MTCDLCATDGELYRRGTMLLCEQCAHEYDRRYPDGKP